jgi:ATP synthase protein I
MSGDDQRDDGTATSFEARLRSARQRQGLETAASPAGRDPAAMSAMGIGMRVGVELVAALVVGVAIGWGLDHWLHTMPAFLVVFVLLGGAAGVANVMRLMGRGRTPGGETTGPRGPTE